MRLGTIKLKGRRYPARGFTIVELTIVIAVIGILVAIVMVTYPKVRNEAINSGRLSTLTTYRDAFSLYASQESEYPPVPTSDMYYCLGTNLASSAFITTNGGGTTPTTILGEPAQYCNEILNSANRYAGYPPLNASLATIVDMNEKSAEENLESYKNIIGPVVQYIDAGSGTSRIKILNVFKGSDCPDGTNLISTPDSDRVICSLDLNKPYPVSYTSETWTYPS